MTERSDAFIIRYLSYKRMAVLMLVIPLFIIQNSRTDEKKRAGLGITD